METPMKKAIVMIACALALAACTTGTTPYAVGSGIAPIPGSITYGGQPRTKLTKSPIGSIFEHRFTDSLGRGVVEIYRIEPDRSLTILSRRYEPVFPRFGR